MRGLKNQQGMTIVSALIGAAIIAGLSIVLLQQAEMGRKSSQTVAAKIELEQVHARVLNILRDPKSCALTFAGKQIGQEEAISLKKARGDGSEDGAFSLGGETSKIKLLGMKLYNPQVDEIPAKAPAVNNNITPTGREVLVGFSYEKYAPGVDDEGKTKASKIFGSHNDLKFAVLRVNNFIQKGGEGAYYYDPALCQGSDTLMGESYTVEVSDGSAQTIKNFFPCFDTKITNPISSCSL